VLWPPRCRDIVPALQQLAKRATHNEAAAVAAAKLLLSAVDALGELLPQLLPPLPLPALQQRNSDIISRWSLLTPCSPCTFICRHARRDAPKPRRAASC
jgi:thiol-disulfide isomerase/thioredoxin